MSTTKFVVPYEEVTILETPRSSRGTDNFLELGVLLVHRRLLEGGHGRNIRRLYWMLIWRSYGDVTCVELEHDG